MTIKHLKINQKTTPHPNCLVMELDGRVMEFFYVVVCFAHLHKYRPVF
jgi:hypothetical protein